MNNTGRSTVVGVFDSNERARDAITALKDAGFAPGDIGILMKDRGPAQDMAEETGTQATAGAATGAIAGGVLGTLAGWLIGVGALAIPGLGPVIAGGAVAGALAGAGVGAGLGAVAGALVGMGIPEEEAGWYQSEVQEGRALVTVFAHGRYEKARGIMRDHGAYDVHDRSVAATTASTADDASSRGAGRWDDRMPSYRSHWQQRHGTTGGQWEEYEPGYHYAWEMHRRPEYRGRSWDEVEPLFRQDWQARHPNRPWDRTVDAARDAWEDLAGQDMKTGRTSYAAAGSYDRDEGYDIIGGEDQPGHEHRFVGERCEHCGAIRRRRVAE